MVARLVARQKVPISAWTFFGYYTYWFLKAHKLYKHILQNCQTMYNLPHGKTDNFK